LATGRFLGLFGLAADTDPGVVVITAGASNDWESVAESFDPDVTATASVADLSRLGLVDFGLNDLARSAAEAETGDTAGPGGAGDGIGGNGIGSRALLDVNIHSAEANVPSGGCNGIDSSSTESSLASGEEEFSPTANDRGKLRTWSRCSGRGCCYIGGNYDWFLIGSRGGWRRI